MTVQEGIYMETTQGKLGIGDTASRITYRNFYAVRQSGNRVELFLLDDSMELTGLRESVSPMELQGRFEYQPQLAERFQHLCTQMKAPAAAPPSTRPAASPPQTRPASQAPQTRPPAEPPTRRPPAQPPAKESAKETPWWEATTKGAENLFKK